MQHQTTRPMAPTSALTVQLPIIARSREGPIASGVGEDWLLIGRSVSFFGLLGHSRTGLHLDKTNTSPAAAPSAITDPGRARWRIPLFRTLRLQLRFLLPLALTL